MKDRAVWAFLVFAVLVLGGIYLLRNKPAPAPAPTPPASGVTRLVAPSAPVAKPASTPASVTPPLPGPAGPVVRAGRNGDPVTIQDGKTIDMSSGRPVVRDDARSRAAIDKSVKEMEEAAKDVTFGPRPATPVEKKKAEEPAPKP